MVTDFSAMTIAERLAQFAVAASYDDLSEAAREQLKIRVLDALACAIGAVDGEPVRLVRAQVEEFNGSGPCSLIGGGHAAPDRAAFYNSALVRYLDFNDSYLAKGETCHPSDNLGAVLAAAEYARASGRDFLAALALAYQVQCRLSDVAPVRHAGFDHVTQGAYAVAAGGARALGLDPARTAHAIAIAGTAFNAIAWAVRAGSRPSADRKSTRLNSSHVEISYAVFCSKKKRRHAGRLSRRRSSPGTWTAWRRSMCAHRAPRRCSTRRTRRACRTCRWPGRRPWACRRSA